MESKMASSTMEVMQCLTKEEGRLTAIRGYSWGDEAVRRSLPRSPSAIIICACVAPVKFSEYVSNLYFRLGFVYSSLFAQQHIDRPAAANMFAARPAVTKNVDVGA